MITSSSDYLWFWWDSKYWIAYSPEQSNIIEKHYTHNYNACVITCNGNRYLIHFEKLLQVNVKTQRVRRIIRAKQSNQTKTFFGICTVCFQERELFSTDNCKHQPDICQTCTMEYLLSRMNDKVSSISCINTDCQEEYSNEDISRYLNSHQKKNWLELSTRNYFNQQENNIRYCANPKCQTPFEIDPKDSFFRCVECNTKTCIRHRVIFHDGMSCDDYDRSTILKNHQKVKKCPRCLQLLEKSGGCSHYKCVCGHEFCWKCLAPYDNIREYGNHYHRQNCKFFYPDLSKGGNLKK